MTAPLGRGRIVLVATDGSLSSVDATTGEPWTNWPTWPSFLPIVRELLAYATGGQHDHWQQLVGTPLASQSVPPPMRAKLQLKRPDGRTAPVSITIHARRFRVELRRHGCQRHLHVDRPAARPIAAIRGQRRHERKRSRQSRSRQHLPPELVIRSTWQDSTAARTTDVLAQSSWNHSFLWACSRSCLSNRSWPGNSAGDSMSGRLPAWLADWLGVRVPSTADGATWQLDSAWSWAPWATLLLDLGAILWTVLLYARESSSAAASLSRTAYVLRLTAIGLLLIMLAQWALALRLTGPPSIALVIDRSASMSIADHYDDPALATRTQRAACCQRPQRADAAQSGETADDRTQRPAPH